MNWRYACFDFDLETWQSTGFRCNDRVFDVASVEPISIPGMHNLWYMLNLAFFIETDTDKRAFLYADSVCLSGEF